MGTKVIDLNKNEKLSSLVNEIKNLHTLLAQTEDSLKLKKDELGEISMKDFIKDLDKEVPDCRSSHDYHIDDGMVRVSFKVYSDKMKEICGKPVKEYLEEIFGDKTKRLFNFDDTIEVISREATIRKQATTHPDLFNIELKHLTPDQLLSLVIEHPEYMQVTVKDVKRYAEYFPASVKKTPEAKVKGEFIEKVSKLDDNILKKAGGFLRKFLKEKVKAAVVCGNRSKE